MIALLIMYGPAAAVFVIFTVAWFLPARPRKPRRRKVHTYNTRPCNGC